MDLNGSRDGERPGQRRTRIRGGSWWHWRLRRDRFLSSMRNLQNSISLLSIEETLESHLPPQSHCCAPFLSLSHALSELPLHESWGPQSDHCIRTKVMKNAWMGSYSASYGLAWPAVNGLDLNESGSVSDLVFGSETDLKPSTLVYSFEIGFYKKPPIFSATSKKTIFYIFTKSPPPDTVTYGN